MNPNILERARSGANVLITGLIAFLFLAVPLIAGAAQTPWNMKQLSKAPQTYPAPDLHASGVRALFYQGMPWRGKPTRVFAWYGVPKQIGAKKIPAMVLVHGGGGTAFADWVRMWNKRGYAAIAIDTCGNVPIPAPNHGWQRQAFGGPACWDASFDQIDWPEKDQWTYQAVADIVLANSLLRSFPEVDPKHIGITGISWGGYLTTIAASIDSRFRFAVPVYGCGFLGEDSAWVPDFKKMGEVKARKWLDLWDPSVYLGRAKIPFLWVDGTNDPFYPLDSLQKSYRLPRGARTLSIRVRMPHNHPDGEKPKVIHAFADQYLKHGLPLATVRSQERRGQGVSMTYRAKVTIVRAKLNYTSDTGPWKDRRWSTAAAEMEPRKNKAWATLPQGATAYYFNLIDERGLIVSSDPVLH